MLVVGAPNLHVGQGSSVNHNGGLNQGGGIIQSTDTQEVGM